MASILTNFLAGIMEITINKIEKLIDKATKITKLKSKIDNYYNSYSLSFPKFKIDISLKIGGFNTNRYLIDIWVGFTLLKFLEVEESEYHKIEDLLYEKSGEKAKQEKQELKEKRMEEKILKQIDLILNSKS